MRLLQSTTHLILSASSFFVPVVPSDSAILTRACFGVCFARGTMALEADEDMCRDVASKNRRQLGLMTGKIPQVTRRHLQGITIAPAISCECMTKRLFTLLYVNTIVYFIYNEHSLYAWS